MQPFILSTFVFVVCLFVFNDALSPSSYLTTSDKERLQKVFDSAFSQSSPDVKSAHYSMLGYGILGLQSPKKDAACQIFMNSASATDVETWFHATSGAVLTQCKVSFNNAKPFLEKFLVDSAKVEDLYYAVKSMKNLKLAVDSKKVSSVLDGILKKDASAPIQAYSMQIVSLLDLPKKDMKKYFDDIDDVIQQADESSGTNLYYDNGLFTTAFVVDGIYQLAEKYGEAPKISEDKVVKFANFLISRRHTYQLRAATYLTQALKTLSTNKFHVPAIVTLHGSSAVHKDQPKVQVKVSSLWGDLLVPGKPDQLSVIVQSAKNKVDGGTYLNNEAFKPLAEAGVYELDMFATKIKVTRGFYVMIINLSPKTAAKHLIALTGATVEVKVISKVTLGDVEMSVRDRDQQTGAVQKSVKLAHPKKEATVFSVDHQQKLSLRLTVRGTEGTPIVAQQVFVKLSGGEKNEEIIYVAEPDKEGVYNFILDNQNSAKDFNHQSGVYTMDLIVGDALIDNNMVWTMCNVDLQFAGSPEDSVDMMAGKTRSTAGNKRAQMERDVATFGPQAEIKHIFRQPDKRPPNAIAYGFTVICCLPLIFLLGLWAKLGVNISNFPLTIPAIGFHCGLIAIFGLYYMYFVQLNMFSTLSYLIYLGIPTFICGNFLLRSIAAKRQNQKN